VANPTEMAAGLALGEGPVAMEDGSVLFVEGRGERLSRMRPDATIDTVMQLGGGPNGAAIGPDGSVYICNNGGLNWEKHNGEWRTVNPRHGSATPGSYEGGWIERVDLSSGDHVVLYTGCDGYRLRGPNDLVFDEHGGFWFTDFGKRRAFDMDIGGLFYAQADGSAIVRAPVEVLTPNGVGLSPDGGRVYVAETYTGRLVAFDLAGPGRARPEPTIVVATKKRFDSMAVEADGRIVVASLPDGLTVVAPDGSSVEHIPIENSLTTNVCFGGRDLRTAYVTTFQTLLKIDWPRSGLQLPYQVLPKA
jgi:gluconolactonase